jgi:hypothetical protein
VASLVLILSLPLGHYFISELTEIAPTLNDYPLNKLQSKHTDHKEYVALLERMYVGRMESEVRMWHAGLELLKALLFGLFIVGTIQLLALIAPNKNVER